jgi:hypothetical protein
VADQPRALAEAWRVLRPGGRLALNSVDTDRPHEQVPLFSAALEELGFEDRSGLTPPHGVDERQLLALLAAAGFGGIRITSHTFHDRFRNVDHLWQWNQSSFFGNFLPQVVDPEPLKVRLHALLRSEGGSPQLRRHLLFAVARRP